MAELQDVDAWLDALLAGGLEPAACKRMMRELAQPAEKYPDAAQPGLYGIRTTTGNGTHENWPYTSADVCQTPHRKIPESRCQLGLCQCRV
ncbi:hypothetical protein NUKP76_56200 [Klebsiella variicola]|nr:hypothetical protein NUKP76_56200 [Klebsiella variicola]